jgi:N4-gp56 family major capsid protein
MATAELNTIINPNSVTGEANLSLENKEFYSRTLQERLKDNTIWADDAQKSTLPKNHGDTISYRKFNALVIPESGCVITEAVIPAGNTLDVTEVKASIKFLGDHVKYTKEIDMLAIDPVVTETVALLGEEAATVIDNSIRDRVAESTNIQYAGGVLSIHNVNSKITSKEIRKAVRTLRKANIKPFADGYYHAITDPDTEFDLMDDTMWLEASKYAKPEQMLKGEIGRLVGVRFKSTNNTKKVENDNKQTVHVIAIYGKDTFGTLNLEGNGIKPKIVIKPRGSAGADDPHNQYGTIAWDIDGYGDRLIEPVGVVLLHVVSSEEIIEATSLFDIKFYNGATEFTSLKLGGRAYLPKTLPALPTVEGKTSDGFWYTDVGTTTKAVAGTAISAETKLYGKYA